MTDCSPSRAPSRERMSTRTAETREPWSWRRRPVDNGQRRTRDPCCTTPSALRRCGDEGQRLQLRDVGRSSVADPLRSAAGTQRGHRRGGAATDDPTRGPHAPGNGTADHRRFQTARPRVNLDHPGRLRPLPTGRRRGSGGHRRGRHPRQLRLTPHGVSWSRRGHDTMPRAVRGPYEPVYLRFGWLGGRGSNPGFQLQRLACCRLHHPPSGP